MSEENEIIPCKTLEEVKAMNPEAANEATEAKPMNIDERDQYSLFNDAHLRSLHDELPEQERTEYKKQGEYMYEKDYENIDVDLHSRLIESAAYINEGMKSGLRPSQLDDSEREVMRSIFGKCWYEKYFFSSEED